MEFESPIAFETPFTSNGGNSEVKSDPGPIVMISAFAIASKASGKG
jgi:hypothetical protein